MLKTENNMYSMVNIKKMNSKALLRAFVNSKKVLHEYTKSAYRGDGLSYLNTEHLQLFFNFIHVNKECERRGLDTTQINKGGN